MQNRNLEFDKSNDSFDQGHKIFNKYGWIFELVKSRLTQISLLLHSTKAEVELDRKFKELSSLFEKLSLQEETEIMPMYVTILNQFQKLYSSKTSINSLQYKKNTSIEELQFISDQLYDNVSRNKLNKATEIISQNYLLLHNTQGISDVETQIKLLHTLYLYHYKIGELDLALSYIKQLKLILSQQNRKRDQWIVDNYLFNIYGLRTSWRDSLDEFHISQLMNSEGLDDLESNVKLLSRLYRLRIYLHKTSDVESISKVYHEIEKDIDSIQKLPSYLNSLFHLIKALYYRYMFKLDISEQASTISIGMLSETDDVYSEILYENYINLAQIEFYRGNFQAMLGLLDEAQNITSLPWWQVMELYMRIILFVFLSDLDNKLIKDYFIKMKKFYKKINFKTDICRYLFLISQGIYWHSNERISNKFDAISIYQNCLSIGGVIEYDLIVSYLLICLYLEEYLISNGNSVVRIKKDILKVLEDMRTIVPTGNMIFEEFYNLATAKIYYFFNEEIKLEKFIVSTEFNIEKFRNEVNLIANNNPYNRGHLIGTIEDLRQTFLFGVKSAISHMGIKEAENEDTFRDEYLKQVGLVTEAISHDLKNMLFSIRLGIEQIQQHDLATGKVIIENLLNISHSVEQVFSYLHSGSTISEKRMDIDILRTIDEFIDFIRNVRISNLKLIYTNLANRPVYVLHDKGLFVTILFNLLFNSIKAMQSNKESIIEILIEIVENNFILKFCDNGSGIPENKISEIFKYGYTLNRSGHGIGLSNVKENIEFMNGSISIESKFGEFTSFTITLPLIEYV